MLIHRASRVVVACALLATMTACGADGPPAAVATRASGIATTTQDEMRDADGGDDDDATGTIGEGAAAADQDEPGAGDDDAAIDGVPDETAPGAAAGLGREVLVDGDLDHDGEPHPMPASVAVIGDSIAQSAEPYVKGALVSLGLDIFAYDAVQSRRMVNGSDAIPSGRSAIRNVVETGWTPELWVIALGTNDVGANAGTEAWEVAIDELLAALPADADVVWIDTWVSYLDEEAMAFNRTLRDELEDRDDVWVLDWHDRASIEGLISGDGVHLSEIGRIEYARLVGEGLRTIYD